MTKQDMHIHCVQEVFEDCGRYQIWGFSDDVMVVCDLHVCEYL
jgi:hypothetical protein